MANNTSKDRPMLEEQQVAEETELQEQTYEEDEFNKIFDKILEAVGSNGKYQRRVFFFSALPTVFVAYQALSSALMIITPEFYCDQNIETFTNNFSEAKNRNLECEYSSVLPFENQTHTGQCSSWTFDKSEQKSTLVTEWNLVCENDWVIPLLQSTYMLGVLFGSIILGDLSDLYGRRPVQLFSISINCFCFLILSFIPNLWIYLILRFIIGFFAPGMFIPGFVLIMEILGKEARNTLGILYHAFFAFGFAVVPGIGYLIRDWRILNLALALQELVLLSYFCIITESPRWLLQQGRNEESLKILRNVAEVNGKTFDESEFEILMIKNSSSNKKSHNTVLRIICEGFKNKVSLLRTPIMRRRCSILFLGWFVVSMVYYGLPFSGQNLNISPYALVFLSGISEIPCMFFSVWIVGRFGRRHMLMFSFAIVGIALNIVIAVPRDMIWLNLCLALISNFFNAISFAIIYIYAAELVPTSVRSTTLGAASMWARVGSAIAPFIVSSLGKYHHAIPSTIFGTFSLLAGFLVLFLPDTGNMKLPETIEEVERLKK